MSSDPQQLAKTIRDILVNPRSDQIMKNQMIKIASENLHLPEVLSALVAALPDISDTSIRQQLVQFLSRIDMSRFEDLHGLNSAFISFFSKEKDRNVRVNVLERLAKGMHQDAPRLADLFVDLLDKPYMTDDEKFTVIQTISKIPSISEETAQRVLTRALLAPNRLQNVAIDVAESRPVWSEFIVQALIPYLNPRVDKNLRMRIYKKLQDAKALTPQYFPLIRQILVYDPDGSTRMDALKNYERIQPWTIDMVEQLISVSSEDSDSNIREKASKLILESQNLSKETVVDLAHRVSKESSKKVRIGILKLMKTPVRIPEVRQALVDAFASNPSAFEEDEFDLLSELLGPYLSREEKIMVAFMDSLAKIPSSNQRKKVYEQLLPKLKGDEVICSVVRGFTSETHSDVRAILFNGIRTLSVAKYPQVVDVFSAELKEPGSEFRKECAGILSKVTEQYPQALKAIEDVLLHDDDRELVRLALDGYLKPLTAKKSDVLFAAIRNEHIDLASRQRCLDEVSKLNLSGDDQAELEEILTSPQSKGLQKKT